MNSSKTGSMLKYLDDFDFWAKLARKHPERFENLRERMLAEYLETVPDDKRDRLEKVQWKVNQTRKLARNPIDSLNRVSRLMWDELINLNEEQKRLIRCFNGEEVSNEREYGNVVSFKLDSAK